MCKNNYQNYLVWKGIFNIGAKSYSIIIIIIFCVVWCANCNYDRFLTSFLCAFYSFSHFECKLIPAIVYCVWMFAESFKLRLLFPWNKQRNYHKLCVPFALIMQIRFSIQFTSHFFPHLVFGSCSFCYFRHQCVEMVEPKKEKNGFCTSAHFILYIHNELNFVIVRIRSLFCCFRFASLQIWGLNYLLMFPLIWNTLLVTCNMFNVHTGFWALNQ